VKTGAMTGWALISAALSAAWTAFTMGSSLFSGLVSSTPTEALVFAPLPFLSLAILYMTADRGPGTIEQRLYRGFKPFRKLVERTKTWLREVILSAAILRDPEEAASSLALDFFAAILLTPAVLVFSLYEPLFLISAAVVAVPLVRLYVSFLDKVREREERTESELPFFASFSSVLAGSGLTLYYAFTKVARFARVFKQFSLEGKLLRRNVERLGYGVLAGLESQAFTHPSDGLKRLVLGTTSVWRSGGDMAVTLENRAEEFMKELEDKWEAYADQASGIGDVLGVAFIGLPMGLVALGIAFASVAIDSMTLMVGVITPLIFFVAYILLRLAMPRTYDVYTVTRRNIFAWSVCAVAVWIVSTLVLNLSMAPTLALTLMALALTVQVTMRLQVAEVKAAESVLQRFMRDLTEYRKVGHTITEAIKRCAKQNRYNKTFDSFLQRVSARLSLGLDIFQAGGAARSWLTRAVFFLVHEIDENGGGSPLLLEKVIELLRRNEMSKRKAVTRLKLYSLLAFLTPLFIAFTGAVMVAIAAGMGFEGLRIGGFILASQGEMNRIVEISLLLAVEASAATAFLFGRASDGHSFSMYRVAAACAISLACWLLFPAITEVAETYLVASVALPSVGGGVA